MDILIRPYDPASDREACCRIRRECGWLETGKEEGFDIFVSGQNGTSEALRPSLCPKSFGDID